MRLSPLPALAPKIERLSPHTHIIARPGPGTICNCVILLGFHARRQRGLQGGPPTVRRSGQFDRLAGPHGFIGGQHDAQAIDAVIDVRGQIDVLAYRLQEVLLLPHEDSVVIRPI